MGVSGSAPATPAAPRNKHLAHVSDPRSPTAGILRTPIEVGALPQPPLPPAGTGQERDPRSPTPGISRTPMRAVSSGDVDRLVKQLSEAFGAEPETQEPAPPGAAGPSEEPVRRNSTAGEERPPSPSTAPARPARPAGHSFSSVPNLEEAVPGASGNSHAIRCHPQAAHSVVVARKDSCGRKEERSGSEGGAVRGGGVDPAEDTWHRLCLHPINGPVCSGTTCYCQCVV
uniref:CDCA3 protein n=1 Tax=Malurus cyaneus samueli TaxID=2593467 RepID=A0A8C5U664_9PASS